MNLIPSSTGSKTSNNDLTAAHFGQSLSMCNGFFHWAMDHCVYFPADAWRSPGCLVDSHPIRFLKEGGEKPIWPLESRSRYDCLMGLEDDSMILIQDCFRLKPHSRDATSWSRSVTRRMGKWLVRLVYYSNREIEWNLTMKHWISRTLALVSECFRQSHVTFRQGCSGECQPCNNEETAELPNAHMPNL